MHITEIKERLESERVTERLQQLSEVGGATWRRSLNGELEAVVEIQAREGSGQARSFKLVIFSPDAKKREINIFTVNEAEEIEVKYGTVGPEEIKEHLSESQMLRLLPATAKIFTPEASVDEAISQIKEIHSQSPFMAAVIGASLNQKNPRECAIFARAERYLGIIRKK